MFDYLSYSGRKTYLTCPKKYYFSYIVKKQIKKDPRSSFFGSAIGKLFEWFYNDEYWKLSDPTKELISKIDQSLTWVYEHERWAPQTDPAFCSILRQELFQYVPHGVEIIRQNRFLAPQSKAEVDLSVLYKTDKYEIPVKLGGRADFVHTFSASDIWILDGKASRHREKYVDSEQLIWYAAQHYIKYHVAPTRLGFIFWYFPTKPITWISYDNKSLRESIEKTLSTLKKIHLKQFDPTPTDECFICNFSEICEDGTRFLAKRKKENTVRIESSIFDLEKL